MVLDWSTFYPTFIFNLTLPSQIYGCHLNSCNEFVSNATEIDNKHVLIILKKKEPEYHFFFDDSMLSFPNTSKIFNANNCLYEYLVKFQAALNMVNCSENTFYLNFMKWTFDFCSMFQRISTKVGQRRQKIGADAIFVSFRSNKFLS